MTEEKSAEQLAQEHAEWFTKVLMEILEPVIKKTANDFFIHGYKHCEERMKP